MVKAGSETKFYERSIASQGSEELVTTYHYSGSGGGGPGGTLGLEGSRLYTARENFLNIFDKYIEDDDRCSFITFGTLVQTIWSMTAVESERPALREKAKNAFEIPENPTTAFYDALVRCAQDVTKVVDRSPKFVIMLTDGADTDSKNNKTKALEALRDCPTLPHLIIVGIQLPVEIKPDMLELCTLTVSSKFIEAKGGAAAVDAAFADVAKIIEQASHV
jgi:hypothetical protein